MAGADSMGLNYRRRVIYQALQDTFTDPIFVRRYFDLWQRDHSDEAHFVVTRFASVVAKEASLDPQQKSVFQRKLFHGLTQSYESLPRVPDGWIVGDVGRISGDNTPAIKIIAPAPAATAPARAAPLSAAALQSAPLQSALQPSAPQQLASPPQVAPRPEAFAIVSPERVVFTTFAQHLTTAILANADRHRGMLGQAVADLPVGKDPREQALFGQFQQWSDTRFRANMLPMLRHTDELRYFAHKLYLLAADLIGPVRADRLLAEAAAVSERLPEATKFSPQMLL
jgi:hypothetical protein